MSMKIGGSFLSAITGQASASPFFGGLGKIIQGISGLFSKKIVEKQEIAVALKLQERVIEKRELVVVAPKVEKEKPAVVTGLSPTMRQSYGIMNWASIYVADFDEEYVPGQGGKKKNQEETPFVDGGAVDENEAELTGYESEETVLLNDSDYDTDIINESDYDTDILSDFELSDSEPSDIEEGGIIDGGGYESEDRGTIYCGPVIAQEDVGMRLRSDKIVQYKPDLAGKYFYFPPAHKLSLNSR